MGSGRGGSRKEGEWNRGDNFDYCCFPLPIEVIKPHTSYEFSQKQKIRKTEAKVRSIAVFASIPTLSSRCYQSPDDRSGAKTSVYKKYPENPVTLVLG
jgi:hypothetical protein